MLFLYRSHANLLFIILVLAFMLLRQAVLICLGCALEFEDDNLKHFYRGFLFVCLSKEQPSMVLGICNYRTWKTEQKFKAAWVT